MTIYIVDLEAVDTRYTKEWKYHLPRQLKKATNHEVISISGGDTPQATTPGAFFKFWRYQCIQSQSDATDR